MTDERKYALLMAAASIYPHLGHMSSSQAFSESVRVAREILKELDMAQEREPYTGYKSSLNG